MTAAWREQARSAGEREPYLVGCETASRAPLDAAGFDARSSFRPTSSIVLDEREGARARGPASTAS
jgi:hypothetical protein